MGYGLLRGLAQQDIGRLLERSGRLCQAAGGCRVVLERSAPGYAEAADLERMLAWLADPAGATGGDAETRRILEIALGALALEAASAADVPPEDLRGAAHPLRVALAAIAGLLDGRRVVWESAGFQDLHGYAGEILLALTRSARALTTEEVALSTGLLLQVAERWDDAGLDTALLAHLVAMYQLSGIGASGSPAEPALREELRRRCARVAADDQGPAAQTRGV